MHRGDGAANPVLAPLTRNPGLPRRGRRAPSVSLVGALLLVLSAADGTGPRHRSWAC